MQVAEVFEGEEEKSGIPTMLSRAELAFCRFAAREANGLIVELGPWLGSSTRMLMQGLRDAGSRGPLVSIDNFKWTGAGTYMANNAPLGLKKGECFKKFFQKNVGRPTDLRLEVRQADLCKVRWDREARQEIKFLFCDALKIWPATQNALRQFLPGVAVGGLIADQDWMWAAAQNIYYHMAFWKLLSDGFLEPAYTLENRGHLRAFRVADKITPEAVEEATTFRIYTIFDIELAINEFRALGIYPADEQASDAIQALMRK